MTYRIHASQDWSLLDSTTVHLPPSNVTDKLLLHLAEVRTSGNILPPPSISVHKGFYQGAELGVVTVMPTRSPPARYKGQIYVRVGSQTVAANPNDETTLNEKRRHQDPPFDLRPIRETDLSELSRRQFVDEYLPKAVDRETLRANDRTFRQRLVAVKMIDSLETACVTNLGMLVLGVRPQDFLPGAYIQFRRVVGESLHDDTADEAAIDGTVTDVLRATDDKLRSHNHRRIDLVSADREQRTESYPLIVLQQLIRNAVMHRTYEHSNAPVRVTWLNDRIEILSPGGPYGDVTASNFGSAGLTDYRNPNLAEALRILGYVQRFGVGIPTAQQRLKQAGHPPAVFTVTPTHVLATVSAWGESDAEHKIQSDPR